MFGFFKRLGEVERKLAVYNKHIDYLYDKVIEIGKTLSVKSGTVKPGRIDYNARPPRAVLNQVKGRKPKTTRSKKAVPTLKTKNR